MGELSTALNLRPDLFYLVVYGPGFGESIVLRAPGDTPAEEIWVVVDGCEANGRSPAAELLREHGAAWSGIVLTHPHLDHVLGLDKVLALPGEGPVGCVAPRVDDPRARLASVDPWRHLRGGVLEHVLAAILDRWEMAPGSRWELERGQSKRLGPTRLTALHPPAGLVAAAPADANRLATALLVEWEGLRLVLGSDVVEQDWRAIANEFDDLGNHSAMKLPHHASRGATHPAWGKGARSRLWIATPYNRGRKLPQFAQGRGIDWALQHVDAVHLTGLPVRYEMQGNVPYETTRRAIESQLQHSQGGKGIGGMLRFEPAPDARGGADACFVAAGFSQAGELADLQHGPGTVVVRA